MVSLEPLERRVLNFVRKHRLVQAGQKLLVAVSGGPDSVCLLHILVELQKELNVSLHVAHLNHRLRGADSEADAAYVAKLCRRLGVPATIAERDVKSYRALRHLSMEEAAREVRYSFLAEVAKSIGAELVAVGHTTDDHIETILMHLIRGTGTRGLRGLKPISRWQSAANNIIVVRPLLSVSRQETVDYCLSHQLAPRVDASNLSLSSLRNKIRLQLLPLLKSYNPGIVGASLRTARVADDELDFFNQETVRLWKRLVRRQGDVIILNKEGFLKLPPALERHLLRMAIEELIGNLKDIETRHIESIMGALNKSAGKKLNIPAGLIFSVEYDRYLLGREPASLSPFPVLADEIPIKIPGETLLHGWRVTAAALKRTVYKKQKDDPFTAYFDFDMTGTELQARPRRTGDRFQPLGMAQSKKLNQFMIDAKIPRAWRERVPIVSSPQQVLWVVGWRIDERVKVSENTRKILRLVFERNNKILAKQGKSVKLAR